jgi:4a-hydroxytetrahydrobiopterin dehydratase
MGLAQQKCIPCEKGTAPLPADKAKAMLKDISGWHIAGDGKWLIKKYKFKDFMTALAFVNTVGELAQEQGHHPDIKLGWGYVEIHLQTHAAGGLHENDFILAAKIEKIQALA